MPVQGYPEEGNEQGLTAEKELHLSQEVRDTIEKKEEEEAKVVILQKVTTPQTSVDIMKAFGGGLVKQKE